MLLADTQVDYPRSILLIPNCYPGQWILLFHSVKLSILILFTHFFTHVNIKFDLELEASSYYTISACLNISWYLSQCTIRFSQVPDASHSSCILLCSCGGHRLIYRSLKYCESKAISHGSSDIWNSTSTCHSSMLWYGWLASLFVIRRKMSTFFNVFFLFAADHAYFSPVSWLTAAIPFSNH
jgi:hypothetical protein